MTEPRGIPMVPGNGTVVAVVRRSGGCDAKDFMQSLDKRYQARYRRYVERLASGIRVQSPEHIRRLSRTGTEPVVYELKVDKYRLYVVRFHDRWYATHGREKPKNNQVQNEINKASQFSGNGTETENEYRIDLSSG